MLQHHPKRLASFFKRDVRAESQLENDPCPPVRLLRLPRKRRSVTFAPTLGSAAPLPPPSAGASATPQPEIRGISKKTGQFKPGKTLGKYGKTSSIPSWILYIYIYIYLSIYLYIQTIFISSLSLKSRMFQTPWGYGSQLNTPKIGFCPKTGSNLWSPRPLGQCLTHSPKKYGNLAALIRSPRNLKSWINATQTWQVGSMKGGDRS